MKNILILSIYPIILFNSCNPSLYQTVKGTYDSRGKDYHYTLSINDTSFLLNLRSFEANSKCKGKWKLSSKNTILLECFEEDSAVLKGGYMIERERKVILLDKDNVKIDKVILMRIN